MSLLQTVAQAAAKAKAQKAAEQVAMQNAAKAQFDAEIKLMRDECLDLLHLDLRRQLYSAGAKGASSLVFDFPAAWLRKEGVKSHTKAGPGAYDFTQSTLVKYEVDVRVKCAEVKTAVEQEYRTKLGIRPLPSRTSNGLPLPSDGLSFTASVTYRGPYFAARPIVIVDWSNALESEEAAASRNKSEEGAAASHKQGHKRKMPTPCVSKPRVAPKRAKPEA